MVSAKQVAMAGIAAMGLTQFCPAPFLAPIFGGVGLSLTQWGTITGIVSGLGGIATGVAGNIADAKSKKKRSDGHVDFFSRINSKRQVQNQAAIEHCAQQLSSATVGFTSQGAGSGDILVTGIPSSCMTLLTVITGQYNEGNPIPMGSDSAVFQDLSDESLQELVDALNARGGA